MNLPNKLTVARLCSLPVLMLCFAGNSKLALWGAFAIFVAASITDWLDGRIARSQNLVTVLGKFLDPLADKALVCTVLVYFVAMGYAHPIAVILVLAREFVVSGVRMAAVTEGKVIAANIYGKAKTMFQMVSIAVILTLRAINPDYSWLPMVSNICCWIIAALTAASGAIYVVDNKEVFKEKGDK
ncbi:MAG: CDP-diacylglycerol--glycerol-3-phosphate 3-phosphatidyltransferase [Oscillospiraceae bacterium]|nr:CDP-diacylglycerol--glycerol-3-phosphate 3-phosphatidyltransferase [Oscillospiraceae bacterium]